MGFISLSASQNPHVDFPSNIQHPFEDVEGTQLATLSRLVGNTPTIFAGAAAPFFVANSGHAPLEAFERASYHLFFMHGEANNPLKGSANTNGSTTKDWRTALRHAFLITSGTVS